MTEWQPIETAPKDGTRILVFSHAWGCDIFGMAYWFQGETCDWIAHSLWAEPDKFKGSFLPTHWLPLPQAPRSEPPNG